MLSETMYKYHQAWKIDRFVFAFYLHNHRFCSEKLFLLNLLSVSEKNNMKDHSMSALSSPTVCQCSLHFSCKFHFYPFRNDFIVFEDPVFHMNLSSWWLDITHCSGMYFPLLVLLFLSVFKQSFGLWLFPQTVLNMPLFIPFLKSLIWTLHPNCLFFFNISKVHGKTNPISIYIFN